MTESIYNIILSINEKYSIYINFIYQVTRKKKTNYNIFINSLRVHNFPVNKNYCKLLRNIIEVKLLRSKHLAR